MSQTDHLLIVDDDPDIRRLLADYLGRQGVRVSCAADGRAMRAVLARSPVDAIVLDLMLPGEDGQTLFRWLRTQAAHASTPVLMLTAMADDVDRIIGLEMGADDYVPKPFVPRELLARVRAVLRRARMLPPGSPRDETARYLTFGDWTLDTVQRHLIARSGTITLLQAAEYALLRFLLDHPLKVVSRDALLTGLAGRDAELFDRAIDLRVSRLRKRLGDTAREPSYIKTIRGEGYVLCRQVSGHATCPQGFGQADEP
ncbi:response regulator [Vandammella animalimorsus]|uniref:DNA-binding response regulator n=1 Tax=Vandammella animalimorsus TaxID=2029117 RepID=A0A2A2B1E5_9BURK|nr:response regulator [Vandammella animalimorsus]PAT43937.1 DNA-binding response regulator [Vandammella animalimorsus]